MTSDAGDIVDKFGDLMNKMKRTFGPGSISDIADEALREREGWMVPRDVYLLIGSDPVVQHFRVWDRSAFMRATIDRANTNREDGKPAPYMVTVVTVEEYKAQRRRRK